jgi:ribose-phosphate pyrophosphokinase
MITVQGFETKFWTFPGGERSVKLTRLVQMAECYPFQMTMNFTGSDDLVDMILTANALRHLPGQNALIELTVPYFPFSRQDRVMTTGESFGLQVMVDMIKMCNFSKVTTWDIHSDVCGAMFPAGVFHNIPQDQLWDNLSEIATGKTVIVSPDAGALKKIYKVAKANNLSVVEAKKVRDVATGQIVKTEVEAYEFVGVDTAIIVDDIVDYGRTFVELAKVIRAGGFTGKIILCVTHGLFSGGLTPFEGLIDEIYTMNNVNSVDLDTYNNTYNKVKI